MHNITDKGNGLDIFPEKRAGGPEQASQITF